MKKGGGEGRINLFGHGFIQLKKTVSDELVSQTKRVPSM
jgi:hypothetical protein